MRLHKILHKFHSGQNLRQAQYDRLCPHERWVPLSNSVEPARDHGMPSQLVVLMGHVRSDSFKCHQIDRDWPLAPPRE